MSEMEEVRIKDELNLVHIKDEVNHMEEENIEFRPDHEAAGFTTIFIKEEFILSDEEVGEDIDEEAIEDPFKLGEGGCSPSRVSNIGISAPAVFDDQETELETYEEHNSSDPLSNNIDLSNAAQNFVYCSYSPRRESNIEISTAAVNVVQERQLETCKEPNTSNKLALTENGWSSALNQYVCKFCEKRFNRNYDLNRHIIIHSKPKPHKCDFCEKSFIHKCLLIIHVRRHTGEKPYNCEFCEKGFSTKSLLKVHMMTHTGEKPHKCKFCDKSFRQKSTLIEHVKTHTGEKPYKCEFCDKRFSQNKVLTCHIRTHTGETPYKCEFCDRSFPSRQHLTYHRKTHTRVKP